jgi:hypothetical protein
MAGEMERKWCMFGVPDSDLVKQPQREAGLLKLASVATQS